jgi:exopolyphosphatase / guanosine-5'-triphosphate,3'-diphosphate pyrophosphatase
LTRLAAIDVGTNSVRVYVAEVLSDGSLRHLERDLVITRLGEGVDETRRLGADPLRRTLAAIARYYARARELGADAVRIAATSAARDASNREDFFGGVREATGQDAEVLTGDEEARLSFLGATAELSEGGPFLILDIGGGSTEFVVGEKTVDAAISMDIGSVRLTERHVQHDPPEPADLVAVRADAAAAVADAQRTVGTAATTLVGLAGTITTVAAISLGLEGYDRDAIHHARLSRSDIEEVTDRLAAMTSAERRDLPAMPHGREDVIVAGVEILLAVMEGFGFTEVLVSEADILDGLVLTMDAGGED